MTIASLPWYDLEEVRAANDELWRRLSERLPAKVHGRDIPLVLDRQTPPRIQWSSGHLLLSQACGYDVVFPALRELRVVATPCYRAAGCEGPSYRSAVVVSRRSGLRDIQALRGARCIINETTSHSGMNGLRSLIAPLHRDGRFFGSVSESGSHERSLEELRAGRADVAAIDCVTLALLRQHRPGATAGLRVIGWTRPAPAPPFVTDANTDDATVTRLRTALQETLQDPSSADTRRRLRLDAVAWMPRGSYQQIADLESEATARGYPRLA